MNRVARLTGGHADHSATTPCWRWGETYAIRTKPGTFKGGNEPPHRIFAAALTKDPTAPELHRRERKVLSVHSIGNLKSTPPLLLPRKRLLRPDNLASITYGDIQGPQQESIRIKISRKTLGYFGPERGFLRERSPCVFPFIGIMHKCLNYY